MPVYRLVVDVKTIEQVDIDEVSKELGKYLNGVLTETMMDGHGVVNYNAGSHVHESTERVACEDCNNMSYDGVSA